jgi:hypothetical protein
METAHMAYFAKCRMGTFGQGYAGCVPSLTWDW